jgi:hypothetical protein
MPMKNPLIPGDFVPQVANVTLTLLPLGDTILS